jgi:hypothetical protein
MELQGLQRETGLRLEVHSFTGPASWRWVLTESGTTIAEHDVRLDTRDSQYEAFSDLPGWISWHAAPDTRRQDEARIVAEVGDWIATNVLGPVAGALASRARRQPVTVSVIIPDEAIELAFRPLELAHVDGKPLAVQGVTFVTQVGGTTADDQPDLVRQGLRVLGLFSLPEGGTALNLRRERHAVVGVITGIAREGRAADIRVLQYGVTREALRDVLAEDDGWDIIHVSGHGAPGTLVLETDTGHPDPVDAATLATLLAAARGRLKLVTVAACWSAAISAAGQRRLLGIQSQDHPDTKRTPPRVSASSSAALATELTVQLGCAVLAMRYPVDDEFAIALNERLYTLLADKGQPLARAVGTVLRELAGGPEPAGPGRKFPALSVVAPALFGPAAVDLRLAAPPRTRSDAYYPARLELPGFPPQPERFVGRTSVMTRAGAALARKSRVPGVLLHGMPGGGKTACALELAYNLAPTFDRLIWYKAPEEDSTDEGIAIAGSLTNFALTLEQYLPGFQIVHMLASQDQVTAVLPRLSQLMAERRLLIVIDNAESLLTGTGGWRDDSWGRVITALTDHSGPGRVLVTSRRAPAGQTGWQVETLSVDALSADEALLLIRELPNLQALSIGQVPGIPLGEASWLVRRVLEVAQGHPKLLELADGQAANPGRLTALIDAGGEAWRRLGRVPDGFFATGEPAACEADFLDVLSAWTKEVAMTLSPGERDLFWFLCCLEEPDRERQVLDNNWADLWHRLGREGEPPGLDHALTAVVATGLAAIRPAVHPALASYAIHPGVAEAGREQAGRSFRDMVDAEAAAFWATVYKLASGEAGDGTVHTPLLARAGLAAVPYLVHQQNWAAAASGLEMGFLADPSRANAAAMFPYIQQAARHVPTAAVTLGLVVQVLR